MILAGEIIGRVARSLRIGIVDADEIEFAVHIGNGNIDTVKNRFRSSCERSKAFSVSLRRVISVL
jgi:hypothetical protein